MSHETLFHDTLEKAHREHGVTMTSKDKKLVTLWKIIDKFLKVITFGKMNQFLTHYTTTLGRTIYRPVGWTMDNITGFDYALLCHDIKHVKQQEDLGGDWFAFGSFLFAILYLFVPFPIGLAYFRYKYEREAYRISWYSSLEVGITPDLDYYIERMTGAPYVWAWPFKRSVEKWFRKNCRIIEPINADT